MRIRILFFSLLVSLIFISCGDDNSTPNPEIAGIQPDSGPPGVSVTISGQAFSSEPADNIVTFGETQAPVYSVTESEIETGVPENLETGPVQVEVTVGDQTAPGPSFTVEARAPGINSVEPDSGTTGTIVTINGMNFSPTVSDNSITFNGAAAPVNEAAEDQLVTEVPSDATDGPVEVTVKEKTAIGPHFDVITEGILEAVITTGGPDKDSDGYELIVDNANSTAVDTADTVYIPNINIGEGTHEVELSGVAGNCSISGDNPRSVSITAGDTTFTMFEVGCLTVAQNQIAFSSSRDGDSEIYLMNTDGSNLTNLTDNSTDDSEPVISNNGTKIVFESDRSGANRVYVMNVDGSQVDRISSTLGNNYSWSPDDSRIALVGYHTGNGNGDIFIIDADGGNEQQLTSDSASDFRPSWSPDGSRIAFSSDRDGDYEIYTMNTDGTDLQQITHDPASNHDQDGSPRWSPDGNRIAFQSSRHGEGAFKEVYIMDADGSNLQRITNNTTSSDLDSTEPSWSPDGNKLVFETNRDGQYEIYIIDADGSNSPTRLTNHSAFDGEPFWSPVE